MAEINLDFWTHEADDLYNATAALVLSVYQAGAHQGLAALNPGLRVLVNWDVINQAALDFLKLFRLNTVAQISETTRRHAMTIIEDWMQAGEPLDLLILKLEPWFGPTRAGTIATTEITRIYAQGNISAWGATGIVGRKVWQTANDELVCPICGPLHGQTVALSGSFMLDLNELPQSLAQQGGEYIYFAPPAHPRCRCWLKPVVDLEMVNQRGWEMLNE